MPARLRCAPTVQHARQIICECERHQHTAPDHVHHVTIAITLGDTGTAIDVASRAGLRKITVTGRKGNPRSIPLVYAGQPRRLAVRGGASLVLQPDFAIFTVAWLAAGSGRF
jgi:hypothetical protein